MAKDDRNELAAKAMDVVLKDAPVAAEAVFQTARDSARPVVRESSDAVRAVYDGLRLMRSV